MVVTVSPQSLPAHVGSCPAEDLAVAELAAAAAPTPLPRPYLRTLRESRGARDCTRGTSWLPRPRCSARQRCVGSRSRAGSHPGSNGFDLGQRQLGGQGQHTALVALPCTPDLRT